MAVGRWLLLLIGGIAAVHHMAVVVLLQLRWGGEVDGFIGDICRSAAEGKGNVVLMGGKGVCSADGWEGGCSADGWEGGMWC